MYLSILLRVTLLHRSQFHPNKKVSFRPKPPRAAKGEAENPVVAFPSRSTEVVDQLKYRSQNGGAATTWMRLKSSSSGFRMNCMRDLIRALIDSRSIDSRDAPL